MAKFDERFGKCIKDLLTRHELSPRKAETLIKGVVSDSHIYSMTTGRVPTYDTLLAFLRPFPPQEAVECLTIAGYPVPSEWTDPNSIISTDKATVEVRVVVGSDSLRERIMREVREIIEEEDGTEE
jgi:hypothetical protein